MTQPTLPFSAPVISLLSQDRLSDDEQREINYLTLQLEKFKPENDSKREYYEAKKAREDLRISIPPSLEGLEVAVGWAAAAVDCVEERLDFEGWLPGKPKPDAKSDDDPFGLDQLYLENDLDVESVKAHLDGLTYGIGFASVTTGEDGEPDPLITIESPLNMTVCFDPRTREIDSAYMQSVDLEGRGCTATLLLPMQTITLEAQVREAGRVDPSSWTITNRDQHNLDRVTVAPFINRPRSGSWLGHSEITETVRRLTQSGLRTLAAAEVAREYYAAPQRYVLGAKETFFSDKDGKPIPAWKSYMGRLLALERDEYGDLPEVKEFRGQSLETFFGLMKTLVQILSGEAGIPQNYLGFSTDNPPSADAIGAMENRLVKRAERRQREFGRGWTEVARLAIMVRDGTATLPKDALLIRPKWRPAHTPTEAASADATTKLVGAKILPPNSRVTWDRLNISREDQKIIEGELSKQAVADRLTAVTGANQGQPGGGTPPAGGNVVPITQKAAPGTPGANGTYGGGNSA